MNISEQPVQHSKEFIKKKTKIKTTTTTKRSRSRTTCVVGESTAQKSVQCESVSVYGVFLIICLPIAKHCCCYYICIFTGINVKACLSVRMREEFGFI